MQQKIDIDTNGRHFSLNHISLGTLYSGSYNGQGAEEYWQSVPQSWLYSARPGHCLDLGGGVYVACMKKD